jgi:hypothetical protein
MSIETLIAEMTAVKTAHPALEISDVLRIFNIQALKNLTAEFRRLNG